MTSVPPETGTTERQKVGQKMTPELGVIFQAFYSNKQSDNQLDPDFGAGK